MILAVFSLQEPFSCLAFQRFTSRRAVASSMRQPGAGHRPVIGFDHGELQRAIPIDGYRLFGIDPSTRLVNRVLAASANDGWARLEYLQTIYLAFGPEVYSELSNVLKAGIPVAVFDEDQSLCFGYPRSMLAAMTPKEHYRLFHEMSSPPGGGIQVAFSAHGQVIAALQIYRREMASSFRASDVAFLRVVTPIISDALSAALARERAMRASTESVHPVCSCWELQATSSTRRPRESGGLICS